MFLYEVFIIAVTFSLSRSGGVSPCSDMSDLSPHSNHSIIAMPNSNTLVCITETDPPGESIIQFYGHMKIFSVNKFLFFSFHLTNVFLHRFSQELVVNSAVNSRWTPIHDYCSLLFSHFQTARDEFG